MTRIAVTFSLIFLALFPALATPFVGLEKAAWCAAISAALIAPLISFHTSLQPTKAEDTQNTQNHISAQNKGEDHPTEEDHSHTHETLSDKSKIHTPMQMDRYITPFITTTFFGVTSGLASLVLNSTHGGWYAAACGMIFMFASGVLYEKWTAAARHDLQHTVKAHITTNSLLFGLILAPAIAGGPDQLTASLSGTGPESLGSLTSAIAMGAVPAAITFRWGALTGGGYESRNRNTENQREKQREEDWKRIRPYIGPSVAMALIAWLGSWIFASFFGRPEYGVAIGFVMASVLVSVDISIKSASLRLAQR